jgi:AraC family transcriptional regulator
MSPSLSGLSLAAVGPAELALKRVGAGSLGAGIVAENGSGFFSIKAEWEQLTVEYGRLDAVGDFDFAMPRDMISVAFTPHEQVTWSVDGKQQQTNLAAGSVFVYGERELVWHQRRKPSEYVNLALAPGLLSDLAIAHGFSSASLSHRIFFQDSTILHVAQLLKAEILNGGLAGNLYVESLRNLLAVHLLRNHTQTAVSAPGVHPELQGLKLKQIQDFIQAHLGEELTLAALSAQVPMSQFHFARAFKSATGTSPHQYVLQQRVEQAKRLLALTPLSVAEIAYHVGFASQSHFSAQFRKSVGITPKQFREQS